MEVLDGTLECETDTVSEPEKKWATLTGEGNHSGLDPNAFASLKFWRRC